MEDVLDVYVRPYDPRHPQVCLDEASRQLLAAVSDSGPVPVLHVHLVPGSPSTSRWRAAGAAGGKVCSKNRTIFGDQRHGLITLGGVLLDCALAPANEHDRTVGAEQHALLVLGANAYYSAPVAAALWPERGGRLFALPRANQRAALPPTVVARHTRCRQIIETVNDPLSEQLHLATNQAKICWGRCARRFSKRTAHTLCSYLHRLLDPPDYLQIKGLAFAH